jgi:acetyltransferase-like isoleucine patch superfamily enzyme
MLEPTNWIKNKVRLMKARLKIFHLKNSIASKNSFVHPSVQVLGWRNVEIGKNSIISEDTWLNVNHRHTEKISIIVGNSCFIGRRNFFSSGNLVKIGDYCLTGINCCFLGSNHVHSSPFRVYTTVGTTEDGIIIIGSNCWLGANVTVLSNVTIGHGSIIGAGAVVTQTIPPFSVAVGNPCRVVKRFDMNLQNWVSVKDFCEDQEKVIPDETSYLEILNQSNFDMSELRIASAKSFGDIYSVNQ